MVNKILGDYIKYGKHELVAFVKSRLDNSADLGNKLRKSHLGVLVCERDIEIKRKEKGNEVKFFYKDKPTYKGDSDISFRDFGYDSEVVNEVPLGIIASTFSENHLKKGTKEFIEAREILRNYGVY